MSLGRWDKISHDTYKRAARAHSKSSRCLKGPGIETPKYSSVALCRHQTKALYHFNSRSCLIPQSQLSSIQVTGILSLTVIRRWNGWLTTPENLIRWVRAIRFLVSPKACLIPLLSTPSTQSSCLANLHDYMTSFWPSQLGWYCRLVWQVLHIRLCLF